MDLLTQALWEVQAVQQTWAFRCCMWLSRASVERLIADADITSEVVYLFGIPDAQPAPRPLSDAFNTR
jgi:hypothetical protein